MKGPPKINDEYGKLSYFKLFGENCVRIITTGQSFLSTYKLLRFSK
jgi:hypothetical protein